MIFLYNMVITIGGLFFLPLIVPLATGSRKRRKTVWHRLGVKPLPGGRPPGRGSTRRGPIWVHALSVGEVLSALPLVKALGCNFHGRDIVFSTSTLTGFEIARSHLKGHVRDIIYYPYDLVFSVRRAVRAVRPALVVIVESDIWPNFLFEMRRRNTPVLLVNARLSDRSFRGHRRFRGVSVGMFDMLTQICTQSLRDESRFRRLGVSPGKVTCTGNIKFDQEPGTVPRSESGSWQTALSGNAGRLILVAGSTHDGEESMLLQAFSALRKTAPDPLLIIVPRNPDRARAVQRICRQAGFAATLAENLSGAKGLAAVDVAVVGTMGVLAHLYRLADICFVGGSLVRAGGHNPLEPAAFSKPVLFGPDMSDFFDIARLLVDAGGAVQVKDVGGLSAHLAHLVRQPRHRRQMGAAALAVSTANRGAVEKTVAVIAQTLDARPVAS